MTASSNSKITKTANLLREAIPRMSKLDIPLTPENYHVWYEYTMGTNVELGHAIDELLREGRKFTSQVNNELYSTYISKAPEDLLKAYQQDMQKLVTSLFEKINGMTRKTQSFSGALEEYQSVLQENPDIDTVAGLISNLIDDTESVLQANESMGSMLDSMNEEADTLRENLQTLNTAAFSDQLTGIPNRRAFDNNLEELYDLYQDEKQIFSLLLIDIDHFKKFNDTYGHAVGDRVLTYVASILKGGVKGDDRVARYGGEEFVILLPNTDYEGAIAVGNHVREKVAGKKLVAGDGKTSYGNVTISIGAALISDNDDMESIVQRADKGLYLAKEKGRNQVCGERDL